MAKRAELKDWDGKTVIYMRIDKKIVSGLDQICESMPTKPKRTQLINAALAEYVDRHAKHDRRGKSAD